MKITAGITVKEAREQFHIYLGQQGYIWRATSSARAFIYTI